jgi:CheY-like chemotaxis protein
MRDGQPDLMLLDVLMPGMNGWDVLAAAKADDTLSDIPVLMVSGQDPREGPVRSKMLVATMGNGISLSKLLDCLSDLSTRLLQPD